MKYWWQTGWSQDQGPLMWALILATAYLQLHKHTNRLVFRLKWAKLKTCRIEHLLLLKEHNFYDQIFYSFSIYFSRLHVSEIQISFLKCSLYLYYKEYHQISWFDCHFTLSLPKKMSSATFRVCYNFQSASMLLQVCESVVWVSNSLDRDGTPSYLVSHLDLSCLYMTLWLWLAG